MMFRQMFEEKYMRFPQGREKALTFSYDDGVEADKKLIEIFNGYGLKATFNLNSKLFGCREWHGRLDEEQTKKVFENCGHEIALHGARHIFLNKVPLAEAANEILQNRVYLEDMFGRIIRGMAYAYNGFNDDIVQMLKIAGVAYARTTDSTHAFALPENWHKWNPTCHHGDVRLEELCDAFLSGAPSREFKHRESLLFYIWGHSYEFDDNGNWRVIENLAKKVAGRKDIWFATNGEIYDYVAAYNSLVFSLDGERVFNPSHLPVWIELRGRVYEVPSGATVAFDREN